MIKILPLQVKDIFMLKTLFSVFAFLFITLSFNCYAEQALKPAVHDLLYRSEYDGYVSENRYEKTYKVKESSEIHITKWRRFTLWLL